MNKLKFIIPFGISIIFSISCADSLSPAEFKKYVEDEKNGFAQIVKSENFTIKCIYTPPEYMVVDRMKNRRMSKTDFERKKAEYEEFDIYRLEITSPDAGNISAMSEYFSFYMQHDISKICGPDTVPCIIYHGEPFNGVDKTQHIEIGFDKTDCPRETIFIKENPVTGLPVTISYAKSTLTIPKITL